MNLLLDTHALIWVFSRNARLSKGAADAIRDGSNLVFVSAATAWEIAIKKALGKLKVPGDYQAGLKRYRFTPLDITSEHALAVEYLPPHHSDPFDRLLVAQAQLEKLILVTADPRLKAYGIAVLDA
ncbi:MAG: type II toxin-antitoxin system VapC family toxin [Truepera sp.]|nr:type II toxin-antitoxin system VapC family toxin [Truepera sp.]